MTLIEELRQKADDHHRRAQEKKDLLAAEREVVAGNLWAKVIIPALLQTAEMGEYAETFWYLLDNLTSAEIGSNLFSLETLATLIRNVDGGGFKVEIVEDSGSDREGLYVSWARS